MTTEADLLSSETGISDPLEAPEVSELPEMPEVPNTDLTLPDPGVDVAARADVVPETPDAYAIRIAEALGEIDPGLNKRLHEAGFNNAQAQLVYDLAAEIIPSMVDQVSQAGQRAADRAALVAEFGGADQWRKLATKLEKWGQANLPKDAFETLCQTADGVRSLHRLMTGGQEATLAGDGANDAMGDIRAGIRCKMNDPRYWRDRDPDIIAEVQADFARLSNP